MASDSSKLLRCAIISISTEAGPKPNTVRIRIGILKPLAGTSPEVSGHSSGGGGGPGLSGRIVVI